MEPHIRTAIVSLVLTALVMTLGVAAQERSEVEKSRRPGSELLTFILRNMEQAQVFNRESTRPYRLTRDYKLFDDEIQAQDPKHTPSSEVIANVEFMPPDHKTFQIEKAEGSERGTSIVRHILENESGWQGKGGPAPLTREYYEFELQGEGLANGQACWVLGVKPIHDEKNMIKGRVWVDKNTFLTQQIQGEMAKTPSWWLKRVNMTIRYGDVAGMWMATGTYAVAEVRFFGKHVLTSQAVRVETSDEVASTFPATHSRRAADGRISSKRFRPVTPGVAAGVYVPTR